MEVIMDFFQCVEGRKSNRAFLPREVDKGILEKILKAANRSPSYRNSQPWEVFVAAGNKKEALAKRLCDASNSGTAPTPDLPSPKEWPEAMTRRMKEHNLLRFEAMGIDPEDEGKIREFQSRNLKFYDAPCVIVIGMDKTLSSWSVFDLGLFVQSILLGLEAEGLGSCVQASVTRYAAIIRNELEISDTISLILAVSLGYPDPEAPANRYHSKRREINEFVRWYGF
jgi:nitroreductase